MRVQDIFVSWELSSCDGEHFSLCTMFEAGNVVVLSNRC